MKVVLLAATLTFGNEWYQTHEINWRIPVAGALAAVAVAGIGRVSPTAGISVGLMALIVAATTPLNGKSPVQELALIVDGSRTKKTKATTTKAKG